MKPSLRYLPPPLDMTGVVRVSRSEICEESLVLAAVCCCTLTSAASAKCMRVFLSGLSSKFLQPMHLQMDEHMIFALRTKNRKGRGKSTTRVLRGGGRTRHEQPRLLRTHLVALAVVLQATRPLAVAAFAVPPVRLALLAFADFGLESLGVAVQARLDGFETLRLVLQVVEAVVAVAAVAELAVCEAVAVPEGQKRNLGFAVCRASEWRAVGF